MNLRNRSVAELEGYAYATGCRDAKAALAELSVELAEFYDEIEAENAIVYSENESLLTRIADMTGDAAQAEEQLIAALTLFDEGAKDDAIKFVESAREIVDNIE